jgi:hypothetical protein
MPIALILTEDATSTLLEEGLQILQQWNIRWRPLSFLSDYDEGQIRAVQVVWSDGLYCMNSSVQYLFLLLNIFSM